MQIEPQDPETRKRKRHEYRYDGIYRVEQAWQRTGCQGFLVCQYLLIRADNAPAAWHPSAGDSQSLARLSPKCLTSYI